MTVAQPVCSVCVDNINVHGLSLLRGAIVGMK